MSLKRLAAVKDGGRKTLFSQENLYAFIFLVMVVTIALILNYGVFAYFTLGVLVTRLFEVIFELKGNMLDKPFLMYVLGIGVPAQFLWTFYR
jgi:hypothetical protein